MSLSFEALSTDTDMRLNAAELSRISLINYFGNDGALGYLEMLNDENEDVRTRRLD